MTTVPCSSYLAVHVEQARLGEQRGQQLEVCGELAVGCGDGKAVGGGGEQRGAWC